MICYPEYGSCSVPGGDGQHFCASDPGHPSTIHVCQCGEEWSRDMEFELGLILYMAFYTVRYLDEIHVPSLVAAVAAVKPKGSQWRIMARESMYYLAG